MALPPEYIRSDEISNSPLETAGRFIKESVATVACLHL